MLKSKSENQKISKPKNNIVKVNMDSKFLSFFLKPNSKLPSYEWSKDSTKTYHIHKNLWKHRSLKCLENNIESLTGIGIPTGKLNNIWVLDLDFYFKEKDKNPYNIEDCLFTKTFGNVETYIKENNIYTCKTISGGTHLYFSYDPEVKQTTNSELHSDTRCDGGYVVAPYTKIRKFKDDTQEEYEDGYYTIFNMGDIKPCPQELKDYVINNVMKKTEKKYKKINPKVKVKVKKTLINPDTKEEVVIEVEEEVNELDIDLGVYKFSFSDYLLDKVCKTLPDKFFHDREYWVKFATAMKTLDRFDMLVKWSLKRCENNYEFEAYEPNEKWITMQYNYIGQHNKLFMVNHILNECGLKDARTYLDYFKYKPVPDNTYEPNYIINQVKLGIEEDNKKIRFFDKYNDRVVVVKSDTGTGKTTEFKNYIKEEDDNGYDRKFISIVSRITLGKEQTEILKNEGVKCDYWETIQAQIDEEGMYWNMFEGDNIILTIDSLMKLNCFQDFYGYTIFLDEFNSLVEYLITAPLPNIQQKRKDIFKLLKKMFYQADRILCTDADINDITIRYLELIDVEFCYIVNKYKHNNNIEAEEIFSFNKFIKKLEKEKKFMCCCDSKTQAEVIEHMGDKDIKIITSETKEYVNLDNHDRVIFSPKIVYGLDSTMKRPVFCYFKEHTISPVQMVQQLCRCRNITKLWYLFSMKSWGEYKYHDYEQVYDAIVMRNNYQLGNINELGNRELLKEHEYVELLSKYIYRKDCYDTNKFAHFYKIIKDRGFKINSNFHQTSESGLSDIKKKIKKIKEYDFLGMCTDYDEEIKDYKGECNDNKYGYDNIEIEEYKTLIEDCYVPHIVDINKYLKVDWDKLHKYKEYFLNPQDLEDHFRFSVFFNKSEDCIIKKLSESNDFTCNKPNTNENKMICLHKLRKSCNLPEDLNNVILQENINEEYRKVFLKEYPIVFRCEVKKLPDFTDIKHTQQYIVKIYKNLFGTDIIKTKKSTKKGKSITYYNINKDYYDYHQKLYSFRKGKEEHMDFSF